MPEVKMFSLEFFRQCGLKGGNSTKRKHGKDYFKKIGRLGGRPPRKVVISGKNVSRLNASQVEGKGQK